MKLGRLVDIGEALKILSEKPMPTIAAFKIKKIAKSIEADLRAFEETRLELFERHGERTENGFKIAPEKARDFSAELSRLLETEIDITLGTVAIHELGDVLIEPKALLALDGIILEEESCQSPK